MFEIALSSAAVAASLLVSLLILLLRSSTWRTKTGFTLVYLFAASIECFDILSLFHPDIFLFWKQFTQIGEGLFAPAWLLFSLTYGRRVAWSAIHPVQKIFLLLSLALPAAALYFPASDFFFSPDFAEEQLLFLEMPAFVFYCALMAFLVIALLNLEATLANCSREERWQIKFVVVGVGLYLAALIFYYSQALLYRTINMNLMPVRSLALIMAALFTGYSRFARGEGPKIAISRNIAFQSVVLLVVSLYLIGLGLLGEGMKHLGDSFDRSLLIALAFFLGAGLLIVLLSENIKRRIKLFLYRHFYADKYDYRDQWLDFTTRLSHSRTREDLYRAILEAYQHTFGIGCSALFLKDYHQGGFAPILRLNMDPIQTSFAVDDPLVLELADGKPRPVQPQSPVPDLNHDQQVFVAENSIAFAVPLLLNDAVDGFLVLGRPVNPSEKYTEEDRDLMRVMARQAAAALLNFRLADQLGQARDMEAMGKVSAFVAHDIKNHVYTLSLMVDNAREFIADPAFQADMLESLTGTIARMKILLAQLKTLPEKRSLNKARVDLRDLADAAAATLPANGAVTVQGPPAQTHADPEELHKVLLNLLLNALDAIDGSGTIIVTTATEDGRASVKISDTGPGIPEDFLRHHLFKPFQTTKKKGMGIGLYQCKQIIEAHGGRIEVHTREGEGTEFTVWLPAREEEKP